MTDSRRRRVLRRWMLSVLIVASLVVAAWFAGEWLGRELVPPTAGSPVVVQRAMHHDPGAVGSSASDAPRDV